MILLLMANHLHSGRDKRRFGLNLLCLLAEKGFWSMIIVLLELLWNCSRTFAAIRDGKRAGAFDSLERPVSYTLFNQNKVLLGYLVLLRNQIGRKRLCTSPGGVKNLRKSSYRFKKNVTTQKFLFWNGAGECVQDPLSTLLNRCVISIW